MTSLGVSALAAICLIILGLFIFVTVFDIISRSRLAVISLIEENFVGLVDNNVLGLGVLVNNVRDLLNPSLRCQLQDERDKQHGGADSEGSTPLAARRKRSCADDPVEVLHKDDLNDHHTKQGHQEVEVVEEALKNILVINTDLSRVDQVEDLQEDERVEYVGKQSALSGRLTILFAGLCGALSLEQSLRVLGAVVRSGKTDLGVTTPGDTLVDGDHVGAKDEQEQNDERVVDSNTNNLAPNLLLLEKSGLMARFALNESRHGRLGTKSNGSDDVHDKVDPKELSRGHGHL